MKVRIKAALSANIKRSQQELDYSDFEQLIDEFSSNQQKPVYRTRPVTEAWNEFLLHYYPFKPEELIDVTGVKLTPSYHGRECMGNGELVGYECCCDNCDHYLLCFPNWQDVAEQERSEDK